ncbi:MAG: hypothetical protein H6593_10195 [Flavobacteriales bacterium]|nr:hypothetical protein [Flavobacteriales bacterium]
MNRFPFTLLFSVLAFAGWSQSRNVWWAWGRDSMNVPVWLHHSNSLPPAFVPAAFNYTSDFKHCAIGSLADTDGVLQLSTGNAGVLRNSSGVQVAGAGWPLATTRAVGLVLPVHGTSKVSAFQTASVTTGAAPMVLAAWEVDLLGNNGAGSLSQPGPLVLADSLRPHIAATLVPQSLDYWVIVADHLLRRILAFRTGPGGTDTIPVVSATGVLESTLGHSDNMVLNAQGTMIATRSLDTDRIYLFSFDPIDGTASLFAEFVDEFGAGGLEFSPNGQFLYSIRVPAFDQVEYVQWDLSSNDPQTIYDSANVVHVEQVPGGMLVPWPRLGPDGCIHVPVAFEHHYTSILMPDLAGPACQVVSAYIDLPGSWMDGRTTNQCKRYHDSELDLSVADRGPVPVELDLWPNPTSGLLNLPAEPAWVRAQVYDLRGRSVLDRTGRQATLDVAALAPGAYTLMLRDPLGRAVARGTFVRE